MVQYPINNNFGFFFKLTSLHSWNMGVVDMAKYSEMFYRWFVRNISKQKMYRQIYLIHTFIQSWQNILIRNAKMHCVRNHSFLHYFLIPMIYNQNDIQRVIFYLCVIIRYMYMAHQIETFFLQFRILNTHKNKANTKFSIKNALKVKKKPTMIGCGWMYILWITLDKFLHQHL